LSDGADNNSSTPRDQALAGIAKTNEFHAEVLFLGLLMKKLVEIGQ
jgi:hypothetical protein